MGIYSKVRETFSEVTIFVVRNLVERVLGFVLIPIYTRTFSPDEFGILVLLLAAEGFLSQVLSCGVQTSFFRSFFDDDDEERRLVATSTAVWFLVAVNFGFLLASIPLAPAYGSWLLGEAHTGLVLLTLVLTVLDTLNYLPFVVLKARQRSKLFVAVSWIATLTQFATILVLVVGFGFGIEGALLGMVVGTGVKSAIYFTILRKQIALRFSAAVLSPLLWLGIPVVFNSLATLGLRVADRFFIHRYFDAGEVALYSIADQFAAILPLLVANPFSLVWPAMRFKVMRDEDAREYYALVLTYVVYAALYVGLGVAVLAPDVLRIVVHADYAGAAAVVPLLVVYNILAATAKGINVGLMIEKRAHLNAAIVIAAALLNVALNLLWIPSYGMFGAAWATIASYAFLNVVRWYLSTRYYHVAYEWGRIVKLVAVGLLLYGATTLVALPNPYLSFLLRGAIAAIFPLLLLPLGFYDERERTRIAEIVSTGRTRLAKVIR
jgi:O-antigen/teichoic acid export membrane protein